MRQLRRRSTAMLRSRLAKTIKYAAAIERVVSLLYCCIAILILLYDITAAPNLEFL